MSKDNIKLIEKNLYQPIRVILVNENESEINPYDVKYKDGEFEIIPNESYCKLTERLNDGTT